MDFEQLHSTRRSHRSYVPGKPVSRELLERLLNQAALTPSSYNMQGWHVVAVTTQSEKERMYREACQQQQVLDSGAMLILCGNLEQFKNLPEITANTPSMDEATRDMIVKGGVEAYSTNPAFARDEAMRSASMFAMSFMYAATHVGLGTGPMGGFDREKMCKAFDIEAPFVPVMLISVGTVKDAPFPRGYRRPASGFARFL